MVPADCLEACKTGSLKTGDITVLVALAKFADNDSKVCWPSIQTLCETTGISRPTVSSALDRLTQAGLIETVTSPNYGKGKATKRRLVFGKRSKQTNARKRDSRSVCSDESKAMDRKRSSKYLALIKKDIGM